MSTFDIKKFLINEGMTRVSRDRKRILKEGHSYYSMNFNPSPEDKQKEDEFLNLDPADYWKYGKKEQDDHVDWEYDGTEKSQEFFEWVDYLELKDVQKWIEDAISEVVFNNYDHSPIVTIDKDGYSHLRSPEVPKVSKLEDPRGISIGGENLEKWPKNIWIDGPKGKVYINSAKSSPGDKNLALVKYYMKVTDWLNIRPVWKREESKERS